MYSVMIKQTQIRSSHSSWVQYGFIKSCFPEEPWSPTLINTISDQLWEFWAMKQKKGIRLVMLSHLVKEDELEMQISTYFEFQMSNCQGQGQRNELVDWTWLSVALFKYWPWFSMVKREKAISYRGRTNPGLLNKVWNTLYKSSSVWILSKTWLLFFAQKWTSRKRTKVFLWFVRKM